MITYQEGTRPYKTNDSVECVELYWEVVYTTDRITVKKFFCLFKCIFCQTIIFKKSSDNPCGRATIAFVQEFSTVQKEHEFLLFSLFGFVSMASTLSE